jgi:hypothetical protein
MGWPNVCWVLTGVNTQSAAEMHGLVQCISASIREIETHPNFRIFLSEQAPAPGDLIVLNSGFLSRTGAQTTKSELNLVVALKRPDTLEPLPLVCSGFNLTTDYKVVVKQSRNKLEGVLDLPDAIAPQLEQFGRIPFVLIGEVHDDRPVSVRLNHQDFAQLIVDPACSAPFAIRNGSLVVPIATDVESVWTALTALPQYSGVLPERPHPLREALVAALDEADQQATARLTLPDNGSVPKNHVLASISRILQDHLVRYDEALAQGGATANTGPQAHNEILRISYNFASDASDLIKLVLSIADLKPLVSWCTLGAQHRLAGALAELFPYEKSRKPSIGAYAGAIGDARNSAFHDLFPFRRSLDVALQDGDIHDPSLRIFSVYSKRSDNKLQYRDNTLIDVLTSFTRARERRLPSVFWQRHRAVMQEMINLFDATARALAAIYLASHA